MTVIAKSVLLFIVAGLCEIGGGYLVWQSWRSDASWIIGLCGAALLITYGVVPTYQPTHFGRAYAAYGGVFVLLSVFWGWIIDRVTPDRFDLIGGALCLAGVALMMYWPR